jgi:hypothetical protein
MTVVIARGRAIRISHQEADGMAAIERDPADNRRASRWQVDSDRQSEARHHILNP